MNIPRYVDTFEEEEDWDWLEVFEDLKEELFKQKKIEEVYFAVAEKNSRNVA